MRARIARDRASRVAVTALASWSVCALASCAASSPGPVHATRVTRAAGPSRWDEVAEWKWGFIGSPVALSGRTVLLGSGLEAMGSRRQQGEAYVFVASGATPALEAELMAHDGSPSDDFGVSVALSDDMALVGADGHDVGSKEAPGAAYVFVRRGTTWAEEAELTAHDGREDERFGHFVALSGDTALVGCAFKRAVYVFVRAEATWTEEAELSVGRGEGDDHSVSSIALSGNTAIVGTVPASPYAKPGVAYVFVRSGASWGLEATLSPRAGEGEYDFSGRVALSGDTALIASDERNVGEHERQGAVYVFTRSGATTWVEQAMLTARGGEAGDHFGASVSVSRDRALVAAEWRTVGAHEAQGAAYVFERRGAEWTEEALLTAADGAAADNLGSAVALSGGSALVGAAFYKMGGGPTHWGQAYLFTRAAPP